MSNDFTFEEKHIMQWSEVIMCSLSGIGSLSILLSFCFCYRKQERSFPDTCLLWMSFVDCISSFWVGLLPALKLSEAPDYVFDSLCNVQGVFVISLYSAVNCWTAAFAIHCYVLLVHGVAMTIPNRVIHLIWPVCAILGLIPFMFPSFAQFGDTGVDCFITKEFMAARFILFYIPVFAIIVLVLALYGRIAMTLKAVVGASGQAPIMIFLKIGLYPLVFVLIWFPSVLSRIYEAVTHTPLFELSLLQAIGMSSQGFLNCLVYGFANGRRSRLPDSEIETQGLVSSIERDFHYDAVDDTYSVESNLDRRYSAPVH